jgi:hypothetical protein
MVAVETIAKFAPPGGTEVSITYSDSSIGELFDSDVMDTLISTTEGGLSQFASGFIS